MIERFQNSLFLRLALMIALVFAIGGVAVAVAALAYGRQAAQTSFDQLLMGAAQQISRSITAEESGIRVDLPVSAFELLSLAPEDRVIYAVFDSEHGFLTGDPTLSPSAVQNPFGVRAINGEDFRVVQVERAFAERDFAGHVSVLVGQTHRARMAMAADITRNALIATGLIGLALTVLAVLAVRAALRPLENLEAHLRSRSATDLTPLALDVPREVEGLVTALDRFMLRQRRQLDDMQNFVADASHQLRTPIAALRAQADLAAETHDSVSLRRITGRISKRAALLSRLTDQLLTRALITHRSDTVTLEPLDLRVVAMRSADALDMAMMDQAKHLQLDLPEEPVWCRGDMLSLTEACKNLAANALNHGVPPVVVEAAEKDGYASLTVLDHGPGIPQAHWATIGERYARSTGVSPESAGLGLAIAAEVARAHGGRIEVFKPDDDHFAARIVVPQSEPGEAS